MDSKERGYLLAEFDKDAVLGGLSAHDWELAFGYNGDVRVVDIRKMHSAPNMLQFLKRPQSVCVRVCVHRERERGMF